MKNFAKYICLFLAIVGINVNVVADTFTKITSLSNLTTGKYVIVANGTDEAMTPFRRRSATVESWGSVSITITSGTTITINTDTIVFDITKNNDVYTISQNGKYVHFTGDGGTNNDQMEGNTPTNTREQFTVTYASSTGFAFQSKWNGGQYFKYSTNNGMHTFGNWKSNAGNTSNVRLFKLTTEDPKYTVTLQSKNPDPYGSAGTASVKVANGAPMPSITLPVAEGYDFLGYFDAIYDGTKYYNGDGTSAKNYDKGAAATFYGHWQGHAYTINYFDQGGGAFSGVHASGYPTKHTYGGGATELKTATRTGYDFGGWYWDNPECNNDSKLKTTLGSIAYKADINLYAKWTAHTTLLTLDARTNGGTSDGAALIDYGSDEMLVDPEANHGGKHLNGFWSAADGGVKVIDASGNLVADATGYTDAEGKWAKDQDEVTLYAQYDANYSNYQTYCAREVQFRGEGYGEAGTWPADVTNAKRGALVAEPVAPVWAGHDFAGWYDDAECSDGHAWNFETGVVGTGDVTTLYAKWNQNSTDVTFDPNNGDLNGCLGFKNIPYGNDEAVCATLQRTGYTFAGYYTEGGEQIFAADGMMQTVDGYTNAEGWAYLGTELTLYAGWTPNNPGVVTISGNYFYFEGETITLTASAENTLAAEGVTYVWKKGGVVVDGQTTATLTISDCHFSDAGNYTCTISNNGAESTSDAFGVKILNMYMKYNDLSDKENRAFTKIDEATAYVEFDLDEGQTYKFCIVDGVGGVYANEGTMTELNCTNWTMTTGGNCGIATTLSGTYRFVIDYSAMPTLTISAIYPNPNQAADYPIYFDNSENWSKVVYRIGNGTQTADAKVLTAVPGTRRLYQTTSSEFNAFLAWHIADNNGWTGDNNVYRTKTNGDQYEISNSSEFQKVAVTEAGMTLTMSSAHSTGEMDINNNAEFYGTTRHLGLLTHNVSIVAPTNGTVTVAYTDIEGAAQNMTSGNADLAHTCILTISATPAAGYKLTALTVNGQAFTSGNEYDLTENAVIAVTFAPITYQVSYNGNGNTGGSMANTNFTYGVANTLRKNDYTRVGYNFIGWARTADGEVVYSDQESVSNLTTTDGAIVELFAKWTGKTINLTWDAATNGGTIEGEDTKVTTYIYDGESVVLPTPDARDGYTFKGWFTSAGGNTQVTEVGTTRKPTTDQIYYAQWTKQIGTLSLLGDVHLTTGNGIQVYTTTEANNLITLTCDNLGAANSFKIEYLDESDNVVEKGNSLFRLCYAPGDDQGKGEYNVADAQNIPLSQAEKDAVSYSRKFAISYTPNAAGVTNVEKLRLTAMTSGNAPIASATITLNGRSLPGEFVVATKVDGNWFALRSDLSASSSNSTPLKGAKIEVDNATAPTVATYAPQNTRYTAAARNAANSYRGGVRLQSLMTNGYLQATESNAADIWLPTSNNTKGMQDWYLSSTNFGVYNIDLYPTDVTNYGRHLSVYGGAIGWYTTSAKNFYLLPVVEDMGDWMDIVDWTSNSVTLNMNGYGANHGKWGVKNASDVMLLSGDRAGDRTLEVSTATMTPGSSVQILVYGDAETGSPVVESNRKYKVPNIYTSSATISSADGFDGGSILYVKSGTVTVNTNLMVSEVVVCPGAGLVIANSAKLTTRDVVLRGKIWTYEQPKLTINGSLVVTGQTYYTRIVANKTEYYPFGLPKSSSVAAVRLSNGQAVTYGETSNWNLRYYDGAARAERGDNSESDWKNLTSGTIAAKTYYIMGSGSAYYREYYFPISLGESVDNTVTIQAYQGASAPDNGWNGFATPYTDVYTNSPAGDPSEFVKVTEKVENNVQWWQHVPNQLYPFFPYFYQTEAAGTLTFGSGLSFEASAPASVAARAAKEEEAQVTTQWIQVMLKNENGQEDETNLYVHPTKFTAGYETGYDVSKMSLTGERPLVWTKMACGNLAFNAIPDSIAEGRIAVGVNAGTAKTMTFELGRDDYMDRVAELNLIDEVMGTSTNLLNSNYEWNVTDGTEGRFFLNVVLRKSPEIVTGMENGAEGADVAPRKIIYDDKLFILVGGKVYDGTGKLMNK